MNKKTVIAMAIIIILGVGGYFLFAKGIISPIGGALTPEKAAEGVLNYINKNAASEAAKATLVGKPTEENGVYKFVVKVNGQEFTSYVTKNGKILFPDGLDISQSTAQTTEQTQETVQQPAQQDKPDVKLFVMSYCPYGLQAEKMYLPVYNLLKNKADMGIYFVDYAMHGKTEIDENLRQYCIQKNEKDKYSAYLGCFVKAGDTNACLTEARIDQTKLSVCVADTDKQFKITTDYNNKSTWLNGTYPKFAINADLNTQYKIQGSPTLVINGAQVNLSSRSPEAFKTAICNAFKTKPSECSQKLSETAATPSFDTTNAQATSGGSCE